MTADEHEKALRDALWHRVEEWAAASDMMAVQDAPLRALDAYVEFVRARATVEATTDCEMVRLGTDHAKCAVVAYASHAALESLMKGASDE